MTCMDEESGGGEAAPARANLVSLTELIMLALAPLNI